MQRRNIASGSYLEDEIGFSRAVRVGPHVAVSGFIDPAWLIEIEADTIVRDAAAFENRDDRPTRS